MNIPIRITEYIVLRFPRNNPSNCRANFKIWNTNIWRTGTKYTAKDTADSFNICFNAADIIHNRFNTANFMRLYAYPIIGINLTRNSANWR